jgi:hypothetical protein
MSDTDIFSLNACYLSTDITCNANQTAEINRLCVGATGCDSSDTISVLSRLRTLQSMEENSNKTRSIQINSYYGKKYSAQNYILLIIGLMVAIVAGLWAIGIYVPTIPSWILSSLMSLTIGICSIIIIFKSVDMSNRNRFDYDQYDTKMKNLPPIAPANDGTTPSTTGATQYSYGNFGKHCQDNACCPKFFTFNAAAGYCSFNPLTPTAS